MTSKEKSPASSSNPLSRIGRYEVLGELASGGMGIVYLARVAEGRDLKKRFAIKRIHKHLATDPIFVDMFRDEVNLAARVRHANVVNIVEVGESQGMHHVVMEYVDGVTARELFDGALPGTIPHGVAIRIALDALHGLHAAHEALDDRGALLNIIHRDVTPQNILVGVDGATRLTDFGIARASSRLSVTRTGQFKGKIHYMAPEQMGLGEDVEIDRRVDVFAMGIVLWELLTGKRLFRADSDVEAIDLILHGRIAPVREVSAQVPASVEDVVMKALSRNRDERFPTAMAFAEALEAAARPHALIASQSDSRDAVARCPRPARPGAWIVEKTTLIEGVPSSRIEGVPSSRREETPTPGVQTVSPRSARTWLGVIGAIAILAYAAYAVLNAYRSHRY